MKLTRPRNDRVIAGVCAGVARRYGWDVTIVRLVAALSILLPGPQILIYVIAWLVIPQDALPSTVVAEAERAD